MKGLETFVDWFAGIGGFRLAGEGNGLKCVGACENDRWARQTYRKNFGHEPEFSDAREVDAESVPEHDLFCGGFPCQSFSTAGKRLGFQDTRGTLFFEICRILGARRPNYFLLENVKGLLHAPFRDEGGEYVPETAGWVFYRILETLGDLGYTVQWQVLDSRHWVAQHRERVYIVGSSRAVPAPEIFPLFGDAREVASNKGKVRVTGTPWRSKPLGNLYQSKRYSHPFQGGRVYGPGNVMPTIDTSRMILIDTGAGLRVLTPTERERLMGFPDGWTEGVSDQQRFRQTGNAVVTEVAAAVIRTLVECHSNGGRRPKA